MDTIDKILTPAAIEAALATAPAKLVKHWLVHNDLTAVEAREVLGLSEAAACSRYGSPGCRAGDRRKLEAAVGVSR